ncbi:MAG: polyribonucleotide nucleotidyltransferase, partial [Spirochaetota bacterium]|nr:polyribonucleotide nucleotidyltransferase [Spirochaetota bacterium]
MIHTVSMDLRGKALSIETGRMAKQANGAVLVTYEGSVVLATSVMSKESKLDMDYFPLQVNYSEKYYAVGKIPGGFLKREGRPKDKEILVSRLIDRPLRPLFPDGFRNEVQILPTTISADQINPPDVLGIIASSASLCISDIPFDEPIGAVRIGQINSELIINPTFEEIAESDLDLVVAGSKKAIMMIEGTANELSEEQMLEALKLAHTEIIRIVELQEELVKKCGKEKITVPLFEVEDDIRKEVMEFAEAPMREAFNTKTKLEMYDNIDEVMKETISRFSEKYGEDKELQIKTVLDDVESIVVRRMLIEEDRRVDGRKMDEVRPISSEIGVLPRTHGSALFTRGETQSLGVVTLGTASDMQRFDDIDGEGEKHFMLHYNFPPFSVGEVGRVGGVGRREIGHGNLAERAITPVLPDISHFPYTIRVVSEILESNGSSSMATVCSSSMALFDAGVPIKSPVSGIAMGLVTWEDKFKILTDIQGVEDHLGDMDFKVAGTRDGITAFQLDIKIEGITLEIMAEAFEQAKTARFKILDSMAETINEVKEFVSNYAPKIISLDVHPDKIKDVIGPGGKVIKRIIEETGANINIDDYGKATISSKDENAARLAYKKIELITADAEVGKIYEGTVKRIMDFGAFIEILPGKEGLCHISKLAHERVNKVTDVVNEGDKVKVKCFEIDKMGRINLSMKDVNPS